MSLVRGAAWARGESRSQAAPRLGSRRVGALSGGHPGNPGGVRLGRGDEPYFCPLGSGSAWELIRKGSVNLSEVGRLHKATVQPAKC
jgi:hypothetical protein